jgi:hypothetical protein
MPHGIYIYIYIFRFRNTLSVVEALRFDDLNADV